MLNNSPDSQFEEAIEEEDYGSSGFGERIGDCEATATTCNNVVNERKSEIRNPNSDTGESEIGNPNSVQETVNLSNEKQQCVVEEEKKREVDTPPDDDCCPICFGDFTIACKTNCGHWFCATCILQFWNYRAALQKCKCPICARLISKLTPEASLLILQEEEVIQVLKNVQRYNHLFQGGAHGFMRKVLELPLVFRRIFQGLMDPDRLRFNYYSMRVFALLLSCMYNMSPFDFIPTGGLGVRRLFDLCAIMLVAILCLVGVFRRVMLRHRVRVLADAQF
ncbi:hypothetical protein LguiA_027071 [Lonicera macranthoides]